jgi:hypothetical protein
MRTQVFFWGLATVCCLSFGSQASAATLIAHWDFEDSLDLGLDSTPNNNDGTVSGTISQVAGALGGSGAYFLNTSSNPSTHAGAKITVPPLLGGFTAVPSVSYAMWFNLDSTSNSGVFRFDGLLSQGGTTYRILMDNDKPYLNTGGSPDIAPSALTPPFTTALTTGQWHHLALVINGDPSPTASRTANLYINGTLVATRTDPADNASAAALVTVLGEGFGGGNLLFLSGALDDVRVYQGALTVSEIQTLVGVPESGSLTLGCLGALGFLRFCHSRRRSG